jgi:hypothetical protein
MVLPLHSTVKGTLVVCGCLKLSILCWNGPFSRAGGLQEGIDHVQVSGFYTLLRLTSLSLIYSNRIQMILLLQ